MQSPLSAPLSAPLSFAQERLFFLQQLEPDSSQYNLATALRLAGPLDRVALTRALGDLVARHAALRATCALDDEMPRQYIHADVAVALPMVDLERLPLALRDREARRIATARAREPFELARGPLLRTTLVRLLPDAHLFVVVMHHIVSDGWSMAIFARELSALYGAYAAGTVPALAPPPLQYPEYAQWQRERMDRGDFDAQLACWNARLAGAPPLDLPTVRSRGCASRPAGATYASVLPDAARQALRRVSRVEGVTPFMTVLAAFDVLLYRYCSQPDVVVGTPTAGRTRTEFEGTIGLFVNTLALRIDLRRDPTVRQLLQRVRDVTLEAYAHQEVPFDRVVELLHPERSLDRTPLFQVLLVLQNAPRGQWRLPGLTVSAEPVEGRDAKFDLTLTLAESDRGLHARWAYSADRFDEPAIARIAGHFRQVLEAMLAQPDAAIGSLSLLTASEWLQLLEWNDGLEANLDDRCMHEWFEDQAARSPHAVAVVYEDEHVSYGTLNRRADDLARRLSRLGVGPEVRVALCLAPSIAMIEAIVGILKAGGAYVPLDSTHPAERLTLQLRAVGAKAVVFDGRNAGGLQEWPNGVAHVDLRADVAMHRDAEAVVRRARSGNLAYVIFTSGSTGGPKGVAIEHRQLVQYTRAVLQRCEMSERGRAALVSSICMDLGNTMLFPALASGAALHVVSPERARDPAAWARYNRERQIDYLKITPSHLAALMEGLPDSAALPWRQLVLGGEASSCAWVAGLQAARPECRILNHYGPTECTVGAITYPWGAAAVASEGLLPIGAPLPHMQAYVLDPALRPAPIGVPGELYLGGAGVARGYCGAPALTAARFLVDPYGREPGARLYRTGDRARWREDGHLEFLGRVDHQIKLRGYRVEPAEIEATIRQHQAIAGVVVVLADAARLAAYVVAQPETVVSAGELRAFLRQRLPDYLIPAFFVVLDRIPLAANGKVDRRALPPPGGAEARHVEDRRELRTETEALLVGIWETLLGCDAVGLDDNFFDLGGHSLLAMRLVSRVREALRVAVTLRQLFIEPTARALAQTIDARLAQRAESRREPILRVSRNGELPLSCTQEGQLVLEATSGVHGRSTGVGPFHLVRGLRLRGPLDATALATALNDVVAHHEALRTGFAPLPSPGRGDGGWSSGLFGAGRYRLVIEPQAAAPLFVESIEHLEEAAQERAVVRIATETLVRRFDYARPPLMRATLVRLRGDEHVLVIVVHHLICDRWSFHLLLRELARAYRVTSVGAATRPAPETRLQYVDFANWQRTWLSGSGAREAIAYWQQRWTDLRPGRVKVHDLPFALSIPARPTGIKQYERIVFDPLVTAAARALARERGITLYMLLLAVFHLVMYAYTRKPCLAVTAYFANRTMPETEDIIGWFAHFHMIGIACSPDLRLGALFERVRTAVLTAHAHHEIPSAVVWALALRRANASGIAASPAFDDVFLSFDLGFEEPLAFERLTAEPVRLPHSTSYTALNTFALDTGAEIAMSCDYSGDVFSRDGIVAMLEDYRTALAAVLAAPDATAASVCDRLGFWFRRTHERGAAGDDDGLQCPAGAAIAADRV